jgi:hypothetical protein
LLSISNRLLTVGTWDARQPKKIKAHYEDKNFHQVQI